NKEAALAAYTLSVQLFSTKVRADSVQRLTRAIAEPKQNAEITKQPATKTYTQHHAGNKLHLPRFKLSRNHLDNGLCEAFLAELNQSPWDELLSCKLPTIHNPDIRELVFTPIEGERIKEIDQLIYRGRQAWEQTWPEREKDYQLGYFRLGEAFFDANNDGKKEHVIRRLMPLQTCRPLEKGEAGNDVDVVSMSRSRVKQWEAMTKKQQLQQAEMNGFYSSYTILEKNYKKGTFSAKGRILIYQDKIYPTYPSGMSFKNIPDLNHSTWFSIAEFSGHISSKNTYGATPVCSYKLNK
ncbi:hypothetical protein, partial [Pseudoalteromonas rubra]